MRMEIGLAACVLLLACAPESEPLADESSSTSESGDGDGDGDGDGAPGDGDGDGAPGDGDGDGDGDGEPPLECNGHVELCDRPYDEVVFAGTHNAHSATEEGFAPGIANQVHGVATQLQDGVRVMLLDTYYDDADPSVIVLCHGPCFLGSTPHLEVLGQIVEFLNQNPGEVLTLIYEDHVDAADLALDFEATGAVDLVYTHVPGQPWPTLRAMVEADTRLVVTAENQGPPPDWYQNVWDVAWDTPYGPQDPADLSCDLNRGSSDNDLFLVNHWVNNDLGLPSPADAEVVNAYDVLLARTQQCRDQWSHATNFVAVDFYDRGDLFAVVDTLNGL
jgi:hypothetical protein